jgi:hypothetical protein
METNSKVDRSQSHAWFSIIFHLNTKVLNYIRDCSLEEYMQRYTILNILQPIQMGYIKVKLIMLNKLYH